MAEEAEGAGEAEEAEEAGEAGEERIRAYPNSIDSPVRSPLNDGERDRFFDFLLGSTFE